MPKPLDIKRAFEAHYHPEDPAYDEADMSEKTINRVKELGLDKIHTGLNPVEAHDRLLERTQAWGRGLKKSKVLKSSRSDILGCINFMETFSLMAAQNYDLRYKLYDHHPKSLEDRHAKTIKSIASLEHMKELVETKADRKVIKLLAKRAIAQLTKQYANSLSSFEQQALEKDVERAVQILKKI